MRFKRFRWWLEYGALFGLFRAARLLPEKLRNRCGSWLGSVVYHVLRIRRDVVEENLRHAFADSLDAAARRDLGRRFYQRLGATLFEFFTLHDLDRDQIKNRVTIEGVEHLEACRRNGTGGLLTSGHFGNWELLGAVLAAHDYPICYIIKSQSNPHVDRMQNEIRRRAGIGVIRQGASARQLLYALRRGEFIGMLADQDGGNQGLFLEFMGRMASVFRGPAYFAYRTGCPILPSAIVHEGGGRHRAIICAPIAVDPDWDEQTAVTELTRAYTDRLAAFIRENPDHYFWVHRRWKTRPPDEAT